MQSTRGAAVCAAIALMASGLTACGEDKPVETTTTASPISVDTGSSTSSASSSSPSSSSPSGGGEDLPSDMPDAARKETKEGAAAFGKYYYDELGEASRTGDTRNLKKLDTADCKVCGTVIKNIDKETAKGWARSENPYTVSQVEAVKRPDIGYKVSFRVDVAAHTRLDSKGRKNGDIDATKYTVTEHLVWDRSTWQIKDWVVS